MTDKWMHSFCKTSLKETMVMVREHTTVAERKDAGVLENFRPRRYEFWGPGGYRREVQGDCKWDAKTQGWLHWLQDQGHIGGEEEVEGLFFWKRIDPYIADGAIAYDETTQTGHEIRMVEDDDDDFGYDWWTRWADGREESGGLVSDDLNDAIAEYEMLLRATPTEWARSGP